MTVSSLSPQPKSPVATPQWPGAYTLALIALLISLVQLILVSRTYFAADDSGWLRLMQEVEAGQRSLLEPSFGGWTTPLANLVFYLWFKTFGLQPTGYYVAVYVLHCLNTTLAFFLIRSLTHNHRLALLSAALYLIHFAHWADWGPLAWIAAFVQLVVAAFYLASLLAFWHFTQSRQPISYSLALLFFVLALLAKESALSLPLVIALLTFYVRQQKNIPLKTGLAWLLPFFLILSLYIAYEYQFQAARPYLQKGNYQLGLHILGNYHYFSNLIIPNPASAPVQSFLERLNRPALTVGATALALAVKIALLGIALLIAFKGSPPQRLLLAMSLLMYLPFTGFVEGFAGPNRYFYLPLIGFCALSVYGLEALYQQLQRHNLRWPHPLVAIGLVGLLGYNSLPMLIWNRAMLANSHIRLQTLALIDSRLATAPPPPTTIYLMDFPDKLADLELTILVVEQIKATRQNPPANPLTDSWTLNYNNGQPVWVTP